MPVRSECLRNILSQLADADCDDHEYIDVLEPQFPKSTLVMYLYKELDAKQRMLNENGISTADEDKILEFYDSAADLMALNNHLQNIAEHQEDIASRLQAPKENLLKAKFSSHINVHGMMHKLPYLMNEVSTHTSNIQWIENMGSQSDLANFGEEVTMLMLSVNEPLRNIAVFREDFNVKNNNKKN